ncbi:hypothetical protein [Anatilimnocola floriformis]|uniref:hypothetical protein n=1 Tax=Anatilimnocola floriformis TaxID=2948575 RepID=UPI0020C30E8C|nr:hypothetical protein [Anatilimnocola floriformis]
MNAPSSNRTYPLALLFLILTCAAIVAGAIGPLLRASRFDWYEDAFELAVTTIVSAFVGSMIGIAVGVFHFNRVAGMLSGLAVGAILGPLAALLLAVGTHSIGIVAPAVFIGSAILLIVAWLIRPAANS